MMSVVSLQQVRFHCCSVNFLCAYQYSDVCVGAPRNCHIQVLVGDSLVVSIAPVMTETHVHFLVGEGFLIFLSKLYGLHLWSMLFRSIRNNSLKKLHI